MRNISCKAGFASDLVLVHARIYTSPTEKPIDDGTIVIHNGQIRAVGPSSTTKGPRLARLVTVIDCTGMTVTAGLWNHVHIFTAGLLHADQVPASQLTSQLELMLKRWGFTTVFDLGSLLANTNVLRKRIADGEVFRLCYTETTASRVSRGVEILTETIRELRTWAAA